MKKERNKNPIQPADGTKVPRFAGPSTFARLPELRDVESCDVAIVGVPFDAGTSYRPGARFGPQSIRQASRHLRTNYHPNYDVEPFKIQQVADAGDIACNPFSIDEAIKQMCENISKNQRIIMPVSNSGYGIGEKDQFCDEKSPLNPISIYGKTKVRAEEEILNREMSISFRLATVFGVSPRMRTDLLVNNFTYIALFKNYLKLYEPHFRRNYIHLGDIINGFEFSIKNFETMKGEIYNLGLSNANLTKEQLCERIKMQIKDFNYEIDLEGEDEDKRDYFVSNEKIEKLGFQTEYELDMGISELINYYQSPDFKEAKNI